MFINSENEKQMLSSLLNSYNSTVSFTNTKLNNKDCILALDTKGIIYIWIIKKENFSLISRESSQDLLDFSDHKIYFPDISFDISSAIYPSLISPAIHFTKFEKLNDEFFIFMGNFNSSIIRREQIERRISNSSKAFKFHQNLENYININLGSDSKDEASFTKDSKSIPRTEIKSIEIDITLNDHTVSLSSDFNSSCEINGLEIDYENNKMFTFSSNGDLLMYNMNNFEFLKRVNLMQIIVYPNDDNKSLYNNLNHISNKYYIPNGLSCNILSCRSIPSTNKLVCGTSNSALFFFDSKSLNILGIFSIILNKFYDKENLNKFYIEEQEEIEENFSKIESVNCIDVSPYCLIAGCDTFVIKYNHIINNITKIYPTMCEINDILYNHCDDDIFIAGHSNKVLRFNSTGKVFSKFSTSSNSLHTIKFLYLLDKKVLLSGGDSSYIDVIDNNILFKLMF